MVVANRHPGREAGGDTIHSPRGTVAQKAHRRWPVVSNGCRIRQGWKGGV